MPGRKPLCGLTQNKYEILKFLVKNGPATIAEISRATGISLPTTRRIIADLLNRGLIDLAGKKEIQGRGRKPMTYSITTAGIGLLKECASALQAVVAPA